MTSGRTSDFVVKTSKYTHYAPVERASSDDVACDIRLLNNSPFVDGVMRAAGGLLAVLNEQRQILAVNDAFLRMLGIDDAHAIFGLRPGEAIQCVHAEKEAGGCGTSEACATCGAVIAIMAALRDDTAQQRTCVATIEKEGKKQDLYFLVNCSPVEVDHSRYLLLFLQDMTLSHNRAALESSFFHDIKNMIGALTLNSRLLSSLPGEADRQASQLRIQQIAGYLDKEVEMQQVLVRDDAQAYCMEFVPVAVKEIVGEVVDIVTRHPTASGKTLAVNELVETDSIDTDISLLRRVLLNMLINAVESTRPGQAVKFNVQVLPDDVVFTVWNELPIPDSIAIRVFQRNFSTKEGSGRGLGTYTMKLFGETYLGGKVKFTSSTSDGTKFTFTIPKRRANP